MARGGGHQKNKKGLPWQRQAITNKNNKNMKSLTRFQSAGINAAPMSNTGPDSQLDSQAWSARPDWLQGVVYGPSIDSFQELVGVIQRCCQTAFDIRLDSPITRGIKWDGYAVSPHGAQVAYRKIGMEVELWFSIPGQLCSSMPRASFLRLAAYLQCQKVKVTRIDLALDDFERRLDLAMVADAARAGNYSGAQHFTVVESGAKSDGQRGMSVVFGAPGSDKRVTFYDKSVESNGRINSVRIELRLRDALAQAAWQHLFPQDFEPTKVAAIILASLVFVKRGKDKNIPRLPLLDWWQQFQQYIATTPHKIKRTPVLKTFQKSLNWLKRQVSASLYTLTRVCGPGLLLKLMAVGHSKYSKDSWFKTLEKSFKIDLNALQFEILSLGVQLDSVLDAVM